MFIRSVLFVFHSVSISTQFNRSAFAFPKHIFVHKTDLQHGIASKFEINILEKIDKFMMKTFYVHSLENMSLLDDTFSPFVSLDSV